MANMLSDLTIQNFYVWGSLKDKVYETNFHVEEELQENTQREIWKFLRKNSFR
jgi:hypothetical protein